MIELKYSIFFAACSTQQETSSSLLTALLESHPLNHYQGQKAQSSLQWARKIQEPSSGRNCFKPWHSYSSLGLSPPYRSLMESALFLSILTLFWVGSLAGVKRLLFSWDFSMALKLLSCFQTTQILLLTVPAGMHCFSWVFGKWEKWIILCFSKKISKWHWQKTWLHLVEF